MSENEEKKKIEDLAKDINATMKGLEEKIKTQGESIDKLKDLENQLAAVKDNPDKIKGLTTQVEEVIVKLNTPGFGQAAKEKSFREELEEGLGSLLKGKNFNSQTETARLEIKKGQEGLTKAAALITGGNLVDAGTSNPTSANPEYRQNVIFGPSRKVHMRSILTQSPMSGDVIRYPQHVGGEGDFAIQANQGDEKAQIDDKFEMSNAYAHTIAAYYRVAKQALADIPWLVNALLNRGTERYYKKEDEKMLYGVGGDDDIKGINEYAELFDGDMPNIYEAILNGVTELIDNDYDPNGALLRPFSYAELLKYKTTTGEYNFPMLFLPNQQYPMSIAGVPLMMSTAVKPKDVFIGDWGGDILRMLIREGLSIDFSYEDKDNFTKNLVTIRFESRVGLEVDEPKAFRRLDLTGIAPLI